MPEPESAQLISLIMRSVARLQKISPNLAFPPGFGLERM